MRLSAAPKMMNALYQNSCFYITAMQLLDSIYEFIDPHGGEFFSRIEYLDLYESVFTSLLSRKTLQVSELKKFQAMHGWAMHQVISKYEKKQQLQARPSSLDQEKSIVDIDGQQVGQPTLAGSSSSAAATTNPLASSSTTVTAAPPPPLDIQFKEEIDTEYKNLMIRLNKEINIKLDKISNEDLVKVVLPTKVFSNDKIFDVMSDESRIDY